MCCRLGIWVIMNKIHFDWKCAGFTSIDWLAPRANAKLKNTARLEKNGVWVDAKEYPDHVKWLEKSIKKTHPWGIHVLVQNPGGDNFFIGKSKRVRSRKD